MAQRWLIGLGCLFLLLGILLLATAVFRPLADDPGRAADPAAPTESRVTPSDDGPSPAWSAAGGVSLALGAGLIGIGMNQWRRREHADRAARV